MNERIKELWYEVEPDDKTKLPSIVITTEKELQEFAELIVRDCMSICKQHPSRIVSNNWNADAVAPDIVHRFEEHFGVEE